MARPAPRQEHERPWTGRGSSIAAAGFLVPEAGEEAMNSVIYIVGLVVVVVAILSFFGLR